MIVIGKKLHLFINSVQKHNRNALQYDAKHLSFYLDLFTTGWEYDNIKFVQKFG